MIDSEKTSFEYTRPKYSSEEMMELIFAHGGICNVNGIGFIYKNISSPEIISEFSNLNSEFKFTSFNEFFNRDFENVEVLFVDGVENISQEDIQKTIKFKNKNKIGRIIFLVDGKVCAEPFYADKSFAFTKDEDGFYLHPFSAERKTNLSPAEKFKRIAMEIISAFNPNKILDRTFEYDWKPHKKIHYYKDPRSLLDLFFMARNQSRKISSVNETRVWSEYKHPSENYDLDFRLVLPESIKGFLKVRKKNGLKTSVADFFSDPAMIRDLKENGLVDEAIAIGLSDSRLMEEKKKDESLGISYISKENSAGVWTGETFRKVKKYIENNSYLKNNFGFDLVVARPVRGWQIGNKPPFGIYNALQPPFELQYLILDQMWRLVGKNGTLLVQMGRNSHGEVRLYSEQLKKAGFKVVTSIDDSEYNFRSEIRIDKTNESPSSLPRPKIFKAERGIS